MGEVVEFPKADPNRDEARLIQEARALYESVFPTEKGPAVVQKNTPAQTWEPRSNRGAVAAIRDAIALCLLSARSSGK